MKINKNLMNRNHTALKRSKSGFKYLVVHYVGALGDARENTVYYGSGDRGASADFWVGHNGAIWQGNDYKNYYSWHCGGGLQGTGGHSCYGKCTNANSVGIEMCVKKHSTATMNATDKDWYFTGSTIESAAELVAYLMHELDIDISHVIRHYDVTGKICPNPFVYNTGNVSWTGFKSKVQAYYNKSALKLKKGVKVKLTTDIYIHTGVSTKYDQAGYIKYTDLSTSARKKSKRLSGNKAKLKKCTKVQILEVKTAYNGDLWIKIKSGWLPVCVKGAYRVKIA